MRALFLFLSLAAAVVFPTVLLESAKSTGHSESIYRGWRMNRLLAKDQHCGVDPRIDAGQPFAPGLETTGRWAAWSVGSDAVGPNSDRYTVSLKWGLAIVPVLAIWSALLIGGSAPFLAPFLTMAVWLLRPNIEVFDAGNVELTLLGPVIGVYLAGLRRLHRQPGPSAWLAVALSSLVGWQLFPIQWFVFFLPATAAWLVVAWRHTWTWHGMIVLAAIAGALPSIHGWHELVRLRAFSGELIPTEFRRLWLACGESTTRLGAMVGIHVAIALMPWVTGRFLRQTATTLGLVGLAFGLVSYLQPDVVHWDGECTRRVFARPALPGGDQPWLLDFAGRVDDSARILCEATDGDSLEVTNGYSLLLATKAPVLVGARSDGEAVPWSFVGGRLAGRAFNDWTNDELARFLERWNIGWILSQSKETAARLGQYPSAIRLPIADMPDGVEVFALDRKHRYILKGSGHWTASADGRVILTDVVPEGGEVVLSLRHHSGWVAAPVRATIDAEVDPYDPWPIVRLRLTEPVGRLILRRDGR